MRNITVIFFLSLFLIKIPAQDLKITLGKIEDYESRYATIKDFGIVGNYIVEIIKNDQVGNVFLLNLYDKENLNFISSKKIKDAKNKKIANCVNGDFDYLRTLFIKDKLIVLFETKKKGNNQLYGQKINNKGQFEGNLELLDEISKYEYSSDYSFKTCITEDSSKFTIINYPPYERYVTSRKIKFKTYDTNLTKINSFETGLPQNYHALSIINNLVSNQLNIFILVRIGLKMGDIKPNKPEKFFTIFSINPSTNKISEVGIEQNAESFTDITIRINNKNNKLICLGFKNNFASKSTNNGLLNWIFFQKFDEETMKSEINGIKPINEKLISKIDNDYKTINNSKELPIYFKMNNIHFQDNGNISIILENRHDRSIMSGGYSSGNTTITNYFIRKSIYSLKLSPLGELTSFSVIKKNQTSINDEGFLVSYLLFIKNDHNMFIFNDNPNNLNKNMDSFSEIEELKNIPEACLVVAEEKTDGTNTVKKIYDNSLSKINIMPERGIKIRDGIYVMPTTIIRTKSGAFASFSGSKFGLAKIEL